jgi:hypothetical protein
VAEENWVWGESAALLFDWQLIGTEQNYQTMLAFCRWSPISVVACCSSSRRVKLLL